MCIVPHGTILIPELDYKINVSDTINAYRSIKQYLSEDKITQYIIFDPHIKSQNKSIQIYTSNQYIGKFQHKNKIASKTYLSSRHVYSDFIHNSVSSCHSDVYLMTWGAFVPAYFLLDKYSDMCILFPGYNIDKTLIENIAMSLYTHLIDDEKNTCIIFSCDLAHTHNAKNKAFGYHADSKVYDRYVCNLVKEQSIEYYEDVPRTLVKNAKTDAHNSMRIMSSICKNIKYHSQLISYEIPTYFGMATGYIRCM